MIALIRGILFESGEDSAIIETGGIGYDIIMPRRVLAGLPSPGNQVLLFTHCQVLENEIKLYGFNDRHELKLFKTLLGVSGIGARGALNILDSMPPDRFYRAIASRDERALQQIPGIGKKMAQRLLFELKEKVGEAELDYQSGGGETGLGDLMEALEALGYQRSEIFPLVADLQSRNALGPRVEDNIKQVLQARAVQMKR